MACRLAISGTFKNISQAKARAPGVLPKVVAMVVHMASIAVASASSIMSQAWVTLVGGLVCTSVLSTLFTVWCILSQIALDWGFLLVEQKSLILNISNNHWKFCPVNSPPLSCKHCTRWGYWNIQLWVNLSQICLAVLWSTQMSSMKFDAVSMQVNVLNSTSWPLTFTLHGPFKSMATSFQGAIRTSLLGRRPQPRPAMSVNHFWDHHFGQFTHNLPCQECAKTLLNGPILKMQRQLLTLQALSYPILVHLIPRAFP